MENLPIICCVEFPHELGPSIITQLMQQENSDLGGMEECAAIESWASIIRDAFGY